MDFTIDSEQKALGDAVRELAARRTAPESSSGTPVGPQPHDPQLWSDLAEMGVLGLAISEEHGGMGATAVELMLAAQELGRARVLSALAPSTVAASLLAQLGTSEQQSLLGDIADGSALVVPALYEGGRTFSLQAYDVTASGSGQEWTLSGTKAPVPYAASATALLVTARAGEGTGVFLVREPKVSGEALVLDGVSAEPLGSVADAAEALEQAAALGTVVLCAEALGAMETALAMTTDYLKQRKQFGVPLASFQTLTHRAADMYVSVELARSATQFAAMVAAEDLSDVTAVRRARVAVGKAARHVGQEAIQLHGGIGMTAEYAVGHLSTRLTAIEHELGDTRQHIAQLATTLTDHEAVDVFA